MKNSKAAKSDIHELITELSYTGEWNPGAIQSSYEEESAEGLFVKGVEYFLEGDAGKAETYFKEAEKKKYTDVALPIYLNVYLNECEVFKTGEGNPVYVRQALDGIADYPPLKHERNLILQLIYSVENSEEEKEPWELFNRYIENADGLGQDEILLLDTYATIMEYAKEANPECMTHFYDNLYRTKSMVKTENVLRTEIWCMYYLADMYHLYGDYDTALDLYQKIIAQPVSDPIKNAEWKYGTYMNLSIVYLEMGEYEKAKEVVSETEKLLPYLVPEIAIEVEAVALDTMTNIELEAEHLESGISYFEKIKKLLEKAKAKAFFDSKELFALTQCKILIQQGELKQAESELKALIGNAEFETKAKYEARKLLIEIYKETGQKEKYISEQEIFLQEQQKRIEIHQANYCDLIKYYEELVILQNKHVASIRQRVTLLALLAVGLVFLIFIIKGYRMKQKDSMTDALTGLYNRKRLDQELEVWGGTQKKSVSYGVIMLDIDYFKRYNDTYGHIAGDGVLKQVAQTLKNSVREKDVVVRYGGEEFLILLRNVDVQELTVIAERIRSGVENEKLPHKMSECSEYVTISLGGFYLENMGLMSLPDAIDRADKALYEAKQDERNRVKITQSTAAE